jgi:hypothetical protein
MMGENGTFRQKVLLSIIDKALLAVVGGAILAVLGAGLTIWSDRMKISWSTAQEKLFDDRKKAYTTLLQNAVDAVLAVAETYQVHRHPEDRFRFEVWPTIVVDLEVDYCRAYADRCGGGSGGSWGDRPNIIAALKKLVTARHEYRLLIPARLDEALQDLMREISEAAHVEFGRVRKIKEGTEKAEAAIQLEEGQKAWSKTMAAQRQLTEELRATLGLQQTCQQPPHSRLGKYLRG